MKKVITKVITIILISFLLLMVCGAAASETLEELTARRDELLSELAQVNAARGKLLREQGEAVADGDLGKIKDLFPDEVLACIIRDECAKFSIEQTVTQADLDKIDFLSIWNVWQGYGEVCDLTGIGLLTNLTWIRGDYCGVRKLPEELRNCIHLQSLDFGNTDLEYLPEWIGDFSELISIDISETDVASLPETICNLKNLKNLNIGKTKITELPEGIYNLQLNYLNMEGLPIK